MKKLFVVLMCVLLAASMFACGKTEPGEAEQSTSATTIATPEATTTTQAPEQTTEATTTASTTAATTTSATITVATTTAAPELSLSQSRVIMAATDTVTLVGMLENSSEKLTWKSSAPDVLTVENGVIKPLKAGEATVTVSAGSLSEQCKVTVVQPTAVAEVPSSAKTTWNTGIYRDQNGVYFHAVAQSPDEFVAKEQMVFWLSQNGTEPARNSVFGFSYTLEDGTGNMIYYSKEGTRKNFDAIVTQLDYPEVEFTIAYEDTCIILGAYVPFSYFGTVSKDTIVIKPEDTLYFAAQGYDGSTSYKTTWGELVADFTTPSTYLQWNTDNTLAEHIIETEEIDPALIAPPDFAAVNYVSLGQALSAETHTWDVSLAHVSNGIVVKLHTTASDFTVAKEQIVFYMTSDNTKTNRAIVRSFSYYPTTGSYDLITYSDTASKTTLNKDAAKAGYPEVLHQATTTEAGTEVIWFIPYYYFDHLAETFPVTGSYAPGMTFYVAMQGYDGKNSYNISYNGQDATFTNASTYIKWNPDNTLG